MSRRILTFGAMAVIAVTAFVAILAVLDVITLEGARESIGDTTSVIVIVTVAVALLAAVANLAKRT